RRRGGFLRTNVQLGCSPERCNRRCPQRGVLSIIVPKAWPSVALRLPLGEGGFPTVRLFYPHKSRRNNGGESRRPPKGTRHCSCPDRSPDWQGVDHATGRPVCPEGQGHPDRIRCP